MMQTSNYWSICFNVISNKAIKFKGIDILPLLLQQQVSPNLKHALNVPLDNPKNTAEVAIKCEICLFD